VQSYVTLDGKVLDLTALRDEERQYLARCVAAYQARADWLAMGALADGTDNPLIRHAGGWVTRAVWEHPLYRTIRDMESRRAIGQGEMAAGADDNPDRVPFAPVQAAVSLPVTR
jgi:hypothetical protein